MTMHGKSLSVICIGHETRFLYQSCSEATHAMLEDKVVDDARLPAPKLPAHCFSEPFNHDLHQYLATHPADAS
jgi:hypothetical protein